MFKTISTLTLILFIGNSSYSQLIVDTTLSPQQLVQNILVGNGILTQNIQFNCPKVAMGYFDGTNSNIGMGAGLLLTTGSAFEAIGPNNSGSQTTTHSSSFNDPNLMQIEPLAVHDVCILEFDFIPDSSYLEFQYAFGSEEYPEFVGSMFNDAFGFFLSGSGITNGTNIALIPATTVPIAINNVNNGSVCPSNGPCSYCNYYVDNCFSGSTVQYDGFTTVLTAKANVTKDSTYHIKLAIADAGDHAWDSGVFFECGSFSSQEKTIGNCSITGVNNLAKKDQTFIFPNPTRDFLNVTSQTEIIEYELLNYLGATIKKGFTSGFTCRINTLDILNGVYLIRTLNKEGEVFYYKFVKQ